MAGFSDDLEAIITNAILCNKTISSNIIVPATPIQAWWIGLHTADPGDSGTQGVSEGGYAAYTRISVARTTTGFAASTSVGQASPVANIDFPQVATTSTGTFTHLSIGTSSGTTGTQIIASGAISPTINFSQNVTPRITTASSFTLD